MIRTSPEPVPFPYYITTRFHEACPTCGADAVVEYRQGTTGDTWRAIEHCEHLRYTGGMFEWYNGEPIDAPALLFERAETWRSS